MSDVGVEVSVLGVNVGEGDHRHVVRSWIGDAQGKPIGERDAIAFRSGRGKQGFFYLEAADEVPTFLFGCLEILLLRMGEDEIEGEEPGLDVREFMFPSVP